MDATVTSNSTIELLNGDNNYFDDSVSYFIIDERTRKITIPKDFVTLGVESDGDSERIWFECPRYVGDNVDLTTRNIYINFENANGEKDSYYSGDVAADDEKVHFSWKIKPKVVKYKGNVKFIVCAMSTDDEGKKIADWNTTLCTAPVLEGLEVENPEPPEEEYNLINQLIEITQKSINEVENIATQTKEAIETARAEAVDDIDDTKRNALNDIETTKGQALEYIGTGVDKSLSKENLAADAKTTGDALLNLAIKPTASGSIVSLSDSAEVPIQGMKIFGKTTQNTTTGKNLFNNDTSLLKIVSYTGTSNVISSRIGYEPLCLPAGTYTFSLTDLDKSVGKYIYGVINDKDGNFTSPCHLLQNATNYTPLTITVNDGDKIYIYNGLDNTSNIIARAEEFSKVQIQLESGSKATEYEPYTGGIASPNPSYPQELVSVGGSGSTEQVVAGENLFNNDTSLIKQLEFIGSNGTTLYTRFGYEINLPVGTYTIRAIAKETIDDIYLYGYILNKSNTVAGQVNICQNNKVATVTFTINEGERLIEVDGHLNGTLSNAEECFSKFDIMLEVGSTATPYKPYKSQSITLSTPNGLPGLSVSSKGNYTDENGQIWLCDEIDLERGVYVQRVGEYRNTGEAMTMWTAVKGSNENTIYWNHLIGDMNKKDNTYYCMSNAFRWGMGYASAPNYCALVVSSQKAFLYFSASVEDLEYGTTYTSAKEAISAWLAKTFSEENPLIVKYALAEPIETPLSEEEIVAYKALHTYKPYTNIYNEDGAGTEVTYVADTKNYVDNKISQEVAKLSAAIISE